MMMHQTMRWFGPNDPVKLSDIRQAGCEGVVTALHHIRVGEVWEVAEIYARKQLIEDAGMSWTVIESLPVSDDIKRQSGNYLQHIAHYQQSLRNVATCGLQVVTYNFMPVLDWLRTNIAYVMPDGSKALFFERAAFVAFDLFLLKRPGSFNEYTAEEIANAEKRFSAMQKEERQQLFNNTLLGLPGSDEAFTPALILQEINKYAGIDELTLKQHLFFFLEQIIPVAESVGLKMAIHPDDPPYPVLGLPRIVCTSADLNELINAVPSPANGLCFCTGSLGARPDNDIVQMLVQFANQIHFLHLRNTKRNEQGDFYEATHLGGDTDMYAVIKAIHSIQQKRQVSIPMRPDHGHQMLDDLQKKTYPGYSAIGRLKGLAELRGVEYAIAKSQS